MLRSWGRFVYRRRRLVAGLALVVGLVSFFFAGRAGSVLSPGSWDTPGSQSQQVAARLVSQFGDSPSSLILLFEAPSRNDAASPQFQAAVRSAIAPLARDPRVKAVIGYTETGSPSFVSATGNATWILVQLSISEDAASGAVDSFRSEVAAPAGMSLKMTGRWRW